MLKSSNHKGFRGMLFIFLINHALCAQHSVSKFEYRWAFWHPITAVKIEKQLPEVMLVYKRIKSQKIFDTLEYGGKLDAFRHTFAMAYLSKFVNPKKLRKLGRAHEKGNKAQFFKNKLEFGERADSMACEMDLRNNELGLEIGKIAKNSSKDELLKTVIAQIKDGKAWYLKRNAEKSYVTCENEVINMKFYIGKWFVPKCLISSNL